MDVNTLTSDSLCADNASFIQAITDHKIDTPGMKPAIKLILPWPDKRLSPNARIHWAKRVQAIRAARHESFMQARRSGWTKHYLENINPHSIDYLTRRYDFIIDFYPPDKRKRDDDNLIAAFKPYRDGIAQALNIDDFRFRTVATVHKTVIKNGQVHVRLMR